MAGDSSLFWRVLPAVRPPEREKFYVFFLLSALLSAAQILGLAGSEALFLTRIGPSALPGAFIMASLATVLSCVGYAAIVGRMRNDLLFIVLLMSIGGAIALASLLLYFELPGILHALFCTVYITQAVLINLHFWTFAADFFDTLQSKRLFPYLVVGASAGGVAGGTVAALMSGTLPAEFLILVWAMSLMLAGLLVVRHQTDFLRWRTLGVDEADESSTAGMRSALRFLTRSPLARWLMVSVIGMITALCLAQYLYMEIFTKSFDSAESLAAFLGIYLAVSNAVEILLGSLITPWLLKRFGVATANLVHPIFTLFTFGLLAFYPTLFSAIVARSARELVENTVAAPVRQLSYNALPFRFRGRVRALLEGVVPFAAMAMAGALLLAVNDVVSLYWFCLLGASMGALYLSANLLVRREYLRSIISELQKGRLDLQRLDTDLGHTALVEIAEQWEALLNAEREYPSQSLLQLASQLAQRGFGNVVLRALQHPHVRVRNTCIDALCEWDLARLESSLAEVLADREAIVRLAAVKAACKVEDRSPELANALRPLLTDPDSDVRAEAALLHPDERQSTLMSMLSSDDTGGIVSALDRLTSESAQAAYARLHHRDPRVRAASLRCLARLGRTSPLTLQDLLDALSDDDLRVREAATTALSLRSDRDAVDALSAALDDPARLVRSAASKGLSRLGAAGIRAAIAQMTHPRMWTADAALRALANSDDESVRPSLLRAYRAGVAEAWQIQGAIAIVPDEASLQSRFLSCALLNASTLSEWRLFEMLKVLEDAMVVDSIQQTLRRGSNRDRADALEVLSNLGERETSDQFSLLLEAGSFEEKLNTKAEYLDPPRTIDQVLTQTLQSEDRWLRMASTQYSARYHTEEISVESASEVEIMQRLLALRKVPLFSGLSLDRLEVIHKIMNEAEYLEGECLVREGEPGNELFVLLEGELKIYKGYDTPEQRLLSTTIPVGYMGEIAILDDSVRSATAIASMDSRLLTLAGEPFKELVLQTPEISFEIFKVLTARIRAAEGR